MVMAIDVDAKRDYILKEERELPKEEQTVFEIGVIDAVTLSGIDVIDVAYNETTQDTKMTANLLERNLKYVRAGLKGWRNFKDKAGQEITPLFRTEGRAGRSDKILQDESLRRLPASVVVELAEAIREGCGMSEDEAKN